MEAKDIMEKMRKEDRLLKESAVVKAVQKELIKMGYEPFEEKVMGVYTAIDNVAQVCTMEEFEILKGEWIPCSEKLPNKEEYLKDDGRFIVTDGSRRYQSIFDIYSQKFRTSVFTAFGSYKYEEDKCVIAWQPLPAPYQPKGGN